MENSNQDSKCSEIAEVLCRIQDKNEMKAFLEEILTPNENHDLGLRWQLMRKLTEGISQRAISADLGISLCKITRGAKIIKNKESISNKYL